MTEQQWSQTKQLRSLTCLLARLASTRHCKSTSRSLAVHHLCPNACLQCVSLEWQVPYSEHSSFEELRDMVATLQVPPQLLPVLRIRPAMSCLVLPEMKACVK